jgi:spermidine/putrescine transport system permease protein
MAEIESGRGGISAQLIHFYRRSQAARGLVLLSPTMLIMLVALAAPMALLALYSFWTQEGYGLNTALTLTQYATSLGRVSYRALFYRSLEISALVTVITVLLAYPMKIILGYNGVINSGLMSLGLIHQPLEFLLYNPTAVVVTLAHAWAPFAILPIYVSLEKIDRSLLEAGADLGDGPLRRFWRITLPLSLPGVIAAAVLIFVPTTGDYVTPALVGGSGGVMIANVIETQFDKVGNWPLGAALAMTSMAAVGMVTLLFVTALRAAAARIR